MGPVAAVLLEQARSWAGVADLAAWLAAIGAAPPDQGDGDLRWQVTGVTPARLGLDGPYARTPSGPLEVRLADGSAGYDDPREGEALRAALGYAPAQHLELACGADGEADHLVLGAVALALAERCGGMVDLRGAVTPPDLPWRWWHLLGHDRAGGDADERTAAALRAVSEYVAAMPGVVHEVPYQVGNGGTWVHHVVDPAFLRAWLHHPRFHMVREAVRPPRRR